MRTLSRRRLARASLPLLILSAACSAPRVPEPTASLPPHAEGVVLLAAIADGRVEVDGAVVGAPQHVDLDAPADDRYAFRYQVKRDGEVLYERSTGGPVLVDAFLAYWSGVSGVDILGSLPSLGRFPVTVPLIDGADEVQFQLRRDDGTFEDAGSWVVEDVGARDVGTADDVVAGWSTIHESGPSENRLDIAIVADGYTEADQELFQQHARQLEAHLLETEPFASFADYINVHRVDVVSAEAGASYDCADSVCGPVSNALGSIFAIQLVNQITGSTYDSRAIFQADQWRVAQAVSVVPWDHVIVLVNSPQFGGMAVHYATTTTGVLGWKETAVHELAHVLGQLGDEYVFDACIRSDALGLPPNIAASAEDVPWAHWVEPSTPLPTDGEGDDVVGAWSGAYNCEDLYRPRGNCKMRDTGDFCPVCAEQLATAILRYADPVDEVVLGERDVHVETANEDLEVRWLVDGEEQGIVAAGEAFEPRLRGNEQLTIEVREASDLVRRDDGLLLQTLEYAAPD